MARRNRLKPCLPEVSYHIMTRTAQKMYWMKDPAFRKAAQEIAETYAEVYYVRLSSFAFLENHCHLAVTVYKPAEIDKVDVRRRFDLYQETLKHPQKWKRGDLERYFERYTDLSMYMWEVNYRIALEHNLRFEGWGHFWGARFKSLLLETEEDLMNVCQYIEANPVKAKMVEKPSDYAFCKAGKLARELAAGKAPELDPISWLADYKPRDRARAYVMTQDYLAWLYHNPDKRYEPMPHRFEWLNTSKLNLDRYEQGLVKGAYTAWGIGACGSDDFIEKYTGFRPAASKAPPGGS